MIPSSLRSFRILLSGFLFSVPVALKAESIARMWNEQNLSAIRIDFPNPPVHARNLFHVSVAMWDAWASYDTVAVGYIHREKVTAAPEELEASRAETISYAAYRVLNSRYALSVNAETSLAAFRQQMIDLGYDPDFTSTEGNTAAALGNRIAADILDYFFFDGSHESIAYKDPGYLPVNSPLKFSDPGNTMSDPNRWQPLEFKDGSFTQNGQPGSLIQSYVGSHWGAVRPFSLADDPDGNHLAIDPGLPPQLGLSAQHTESYRQISLSVLAFSSLLDPTNEVIDISPASLGNNHLGTNDGNGYDLNPMTGQPYVPQMVPHGDFGRVIAEFWADGPASETPPGHWNTLANYVSDSIAAHPAESYRIGGTGPEVDVLEWDVKTYFALNGAVHDAAIAAWGCKAYYDYVRPISSIRYMCSKGQCSDPLLPSYDPEGIPLVPDLTELVTTETAAPGGRHEGLVPGEIAVRAWGGEPEDKVNLYTGVKWISGTVWLPYQKSTFVTPAFAGYVSGHSTFSRAAAEVLTAMTGSPYFPNGMGTYTAPKNEFLKFEKGPSVDVVLEWATYFDASDQAGISRLYGGIHFPVDDGPGRIMGSECGVAAWNMASRYYDGSILDERPTARLVPVSPTSTLEWNGRRGLYYQVEKSDTIGNFSPLGAPIRSTAEAMATDVTAPSTSESAFYRVVPLSNAP